MRNALIGIPHFTFHISHSLVTPSSQTIFGGSDPGFGDGSDANVPPDTPIDGGISLLIVIGIVRAVKSLKSIGNKPIIQALKRQLISNLFQVYFGRFCSVTKIN